MDEAFPLPPFNPGTVKDKKVFASQVFSTLTFFDTIMPPGAPVSEIYKEIKAGAIKRTARSEAAKVALGECFLNEVESKGVEKFFKVYMTAKANDLKEGGTIYRQPQLLKEFFGLILGFARLCPICLNVEMIGDETHVCPDSVPPMQGCGYGTGCAPSKKELRNHAKVSHTPICRFFGISRAVSMGIGLQRNKKFSIHKST